MDEIEVDEASNIAPLNSVKVILKTVGPSRPTHLRVPSHIKVRDFRKLVAEGERLPTESVRLILRGKALHDRKNGEDVDIQLADGDSFIVAVRPKAPPKHVRAGYDDEEEDEDDLKFQLPESASRWKWRLFCILHDKLKLPDIVLIAIFSLSLKAWVFIILWFLLAPVAHKWELGPLYILATGFATIFLNLGHRQAGELSAYSIFNEDFRELPGTFNADRVDRDIRTGQM
ncbi:uncharacterized protein LOC141653839 [Silene latifolia]|uniref:uncharacterized protein LOC141653839 n=1 Tax=Silene latifolia TaxID=37657 RepID=UPI003D7802C8